MVERHVADPVVALGVRLDNQWVGVWALPQSVKLAGEWVRNGHEGEGVILRWPLVLFVLAWIASHLREAYVVEEAAAAGVRVHRVEYAPSVSIRIPAFVHIFADNSTR